MFNFSDLKGEEECEKCTKLWYPLIESDDIS